MWYDYMVLFIQVKDVEAENGAAECTIRIVIEYLEQTVSHADICGQDYR